jgi:hypothetical protein
LFVASAKAGKLSPPSDRKLFATTRYVVPASIGTPFSITVESSTLEPAGADRSSV